MPSKLIQTLLDMSQWVSMDPGFPHLTGQGSDYVARYKTSTTLKLIMGLIINY